MNGIKSRSRLDRGENAVFFDFAETLRKTYLKILKMPNTLPRI